MHEAIAPLAMGKQTLGHIIENYMELNVSSRGTYFNDDLVTKDRTTENQSLKSRWKIVSSTKNVPLHWQLHFEYITLRLHRDICNCNQRQFTTVFRAIITWQDWKCSKDILEVFASTDSYFWNPWQEAVTSIASCTRRVAGPSEPTTPGPLAVPCMVPILTHLKLHVGGETHCDRTAYPKTQH